MDARRLLLLLLVIVSTGALSGCRAITAIFEAGMWVGMIMVVIVLVLVGVVVSMLRRR